MAGGAGRICFRYFCCRHDAHINQEAGALVQRQRLGGLRDGGAGRVARQHRHRVGLPQPRACLAESQAVTTCSSDRESQVHVKGFDGRQ